jgi:hypothetical protein
MALRMSFFGMVSPLEVCRGQRTVSGWGTDAGKTLRVASRISDPRPTVGSAASLALGTNLVGPPSPSQTALRRCSPAAPARCS